MQTKLILLAAVCGLATATAAAQGGITIDFTDRTVESKAGFTSSSDDNPNDGLYTHTSTVGVIGVPPFATATLASNATPTLFQGTASGAIGGSGPLDAFGNVTFLSMFTLDTPYSFTLNGSNTTTASGAFGTASFTLDGPSGNIYDFIADSAVNPGTSTFTRTGTLAPGSYQLLGLLVNDDQNATAAFSANSAFNFTFALQPVPEPSSVCLAGFGGAMLLIAYRRRRQTKYVIPLSV